MEHPSSPDRLAALEARVQALEAEVRALRAARPLLKPRRRFTLPDVKSEAVLARVGIALLLVGVAFLLKWSIDQGWLSPAARVLGTGTFGALMLGAGLVLRERRALGAVLAGGGLAVLYGSLFAAFQLYALIGATAALVLAALLTAGAFTLALRERAEALAVVGALGALGAPVALFRERGSLVATLLFMLLVAGGGLGVYARTRWRVLLGALAVGTWTALAVVRWKSGALPGTERLWFEAVLVLVWLGVGVVPVRWRHEGDEGLRLPTLAQPRAVAAWLSPVAALALTGAVWSLSGTALAGLLLVGAAGYFVWARQASDRLLCEAGTFAAFAMAAWAATAGMRDEMAPGLVVAIAAAGALWARRHTERSFRIVADVAVLGAALWEIVVVIVLGGPEQRPGVRPALLAGALVALAALGYAALGPIALGRVRRLYLLAGHGLALVTVRAAAQPLPATVALVDGVWGLYAVALIVAGIRRGHQDVRVLGLGTLALTVAKLLLWDLPGVPTVWRVVIFLGLGAALLAASYFAPHLLRGRALVATEKPDAP
jgi:hypothetical protein